MAVPYWSTRASSICWSLSPRRASLEDLVTNGHRGGRRRLGDREVLAARAAQVGVEGGGMLRRGLVPPCPTPPPDQRCRQDHQEHERTEPGRGSSGPPGDRVGRSPSGDDPPSGEVAGNLSRLAMGALHLVEHLVELVHGDRAVPEPRRRPRAGRRGRSSAVRSDAVGVGHRAARGRGPPATRPPLLRRTCAAAAIRVVEDDAHQRRALGAGRCCWKLKVTRSAPLPGTAGTSWRRS